MVDYFEIDEIQTLDYEDVYDVSFNEKDNNIFYLGEPNFIANNIVVHNSHAAGCVCSDVPLSEIAPIYINREGNKTLHFEGPDAESIGLIKFDILGLSTLSVISACLDLIEENYGFRLDMNTIPMDDEKTFEIYRSGKLTGVFQAEERGMQQTITQIGVDRFDDVAAAIALYRPGPMESIPNYVARKHGREEVSYFHPKIEKYVKPYLEKTYGILVYQETIMQICRELAGFSVADGYALIKAISKKKDQEVHKYLKIFIEGCKEKGIEEELSTEYWEKFITPFALYGFNASHSYAYGLIGYQSCYLKANYTEEFFCAYLNVESQKKTQNSLEKVQKLITDMTRNFNIQLTPKRINDSKPHYAIVKKRDSNDPSDKSLISPALMCKGVGFESAKNISENAPYKDLRDMAERTDFALVNKGVIDGLAEDGFFDGYIQGYNKKLKKGEKKLSQGNIAAQFTSIRKDIKKVRAKGISSVDIFG
jgi:DNA polymerase-3 subunit alpha